MQYFRSVSDHYPVYVEVNFGTSGGTAPQSKIYNTIHSTQQCIIMGVFN